MRLYPFIIVNGALKKQHSIFNQLQVYQRNDFLGYFDFYTMIKGVDQSAVQPLTDAYINERSLELFAIDLIHMENKYDPVNLFNKIVTIEEKIDDMNNALNNTLDILTQGKTDLDKGRKELLDLKGVVVKTRKQVKRNKTNIRHLKKDMNRHTKDVEAKRKLMKAVIKRVFKINKANEEIQKINSYIYKQISRYQRDYYFRFYCLVFLIVAVILNSAETISYLTLLGTKVYRLLF